MIALAIAGLASLLAPFNTLNNAVRVNGLVYRVGLIGRDAPLCFNLFFLNFGRQGCNPEDLADLNLETFFQKKVEWASLCYLVCYGAGMMFNLFGVSISGWMIRGSFYTLGNIVIFLGFWFYLLGLGIFEIFLSTKPDSIQLGYSYFQILAIVPPLIQLVCYFLSRFWTKKLARLTLIQELLEDDEMVQSAERRFESSHCESSCCFEGDNTSRLYLYSQHDLEHNATD